jgi:excinuclease ABC subunit C
LYLERKRYFPKTYRKMRTFRLFTLLKINRKQRFPRIYASREVKDGVEYFGPFVTRGQFARLKTTLERTFKLRPCIYNIRGDDPHPDCLYFQMHTCSRPCNNDIDRRGYMRDVDQAILFIQGRDEEIEQAMVEEINGLASDMRFEQAEVVRRRLARIRRARHEYKDTFYSLARFDFLAVLPSDSTSRCKIAFIRGGRVVAFEEYAAGGLQETLAPDIERFFKAAPERDSAGSRYDEFCLAANFIVDPLQQVDLLPFGATVDLPAQVQSCLERRKRKRKPETTPTLAPNQDS